MLPAQQRILSKLGLNRVYCVIEEVEYQGLVIGLQLRTQVTYVGAETLSKK